jgi:hypothetical protein
MSVIQVGTAPIQPRTRAGVSRADSAAPSHIPAGGSTGDPDAPRGWVTHQTCVSKLLAAGASPVHAFAVAFDGKDVKVVAATSGPEWQGPG